MDFTVINFTTPSSPGFNTPPPRNFLPPSELGFNTPPPTDFTPPFSLRTPPWAPAAVRQEPSDEQKQLRNTALISKINNELRGFENRLKNHEPLNEGLAKEITLEFIRKMDFILPDRLARRFDTDTALKINDSLRRVYDSFLSHNSVKELGRNKPLKILKRTNPNSTKRSFILLTRALKEKGIRVDELRAVIKIQRLFERFGFSITNPNERALYLLRKRTSNLTKELICSFLPKNGVLKGLKILSYPGYTPFFKKIDEEYPPFESLELSPEQMQDVLPHLTRLNLLLDPSKEDDFLSFSLETPSLSTYDEETAGNIVSVLSKDATKIKELAVGQEFIKYFESFEEFMSFLKNFTSLESLDFSNSEINEEELKILSNNLPYLKSIKEIKTNPYCYYDPEFIDDLNTRFPGLFIFNTPRQISRPTDL